MTVVSSRENGSRRISKLGHTRACVLKSQVNIIQSLLSVSKINAIWLGSASLHACAINHKKFILYKLLACWYDFLPESYSMESDPDIYVTLTDEMFQPSLLGKTIAKLSSFIPNVHNALNAGTTLVQYRWVQQVMCIVLYILLGVQMHVFVLLFLWGIIWRWTCLLVWQLDQVWDQQQCGDNYRR